MVYNCGYPIWHTFYTSTTGQYIDYSIILNNQTIYEGKVIPFNPTDTTIRVDISNVCRSYLETFYERIAISDISNSLVPIDGLKSTVNTFYVSSEANSTGSTSPNIPYTVIYDYNTDYILTNDDIGNRNNPILLEADPRQYLTITGYAAIGSTTYGWSKNGGAINSFNTLGIRYQNLGISLDSPTVNAQVGDTITMSQGGGNIASFTYKVVQPCRNRFVLYYVNKLGGLDSLLCSGRYYVKGWNPTRTNARFYDDRTNRRDFQQTRIYQDIGHRWELQTGWVNDDKAELIDELIYSPKSWIHDLDNNTITSCLVTDTSFNATRFELNRTPAMYTINVEESQLHERQ